MVLDVGLCMATSPVYRLWPQQVEKSMNHHRPRNFPGQCVVGDGMAGARLSDLVSNKSGSNAGWLQSERGKDEIILVSRR